MLTFLFIAYLAIRMKITPEMVGLFFKNQKKEINSDFGTTKPSAKITSEEKEWVKGSLKEPENLQQEETSEKEFSISEVTLQKKKNHWNKKLNEPQRSTYHQSIVHALEYAENGGKVKWYLNDASGYSVPVVTWPVSDGYCRRLHLSVIAHGKHKTKAVSACFSNMDSNWTWHRE